MRKLYFLTFLSLLTVIAPISIHAQDQVNVLTQQWDGGHWENLDESTNFLYNTNCQLVYDLFKEWDSVANNWDNYSQFYFSYYGSGKVYQDSTQEWNPSTSDWNNHFLIKYMYDGSNYLINQSFQSWDTTTNIWQNYLQTNYINNADGTPHIAYNLTWSGGVWDTSAAKTYYIYNILGQLDTELIGTTTRQSFTYDAGYTSVLDQNWNTATNSWQNGTLVLYYPNINAPDSIISELWNSAANTWGIPFAKTTDAYTPCTPAAILQINPADPIQVCPDPTTGRFTVTALTGGQSVELYNFEGRRLDSRIADHTTMDFNIAGYASGMYLIKIQNQDGSMAAQKKIVKNQ